MQNSDEKGPCYCECWRWYMYGGFGKYLIRNYQFSGEQVTEMLTTLLLSPTARQIFQGVAPPQAGRASNQMPLNFQNV